MPLLVFILDRYDANGDMRYSHKSFRNLLYRDMVGTSLGGTNEYIIKYAKCTSSELKHLFEPSMKEKIVHDISENDTIGFHNVDKAAVMFVIHPNANKQTPLTSSLPSTLRLSIRGKTQSDRLLTIQNHRSARIDNAIMLDTVSDVREIIVSSITMYDTFLKIATIINLK